MPFVLSLDEGTTSARAALYDEQGRRWPWSPATFDARYPATGMGGAGCGRDLARANEVRAGGCWSGRGVAASEIAARASPISARRRWCGSRTGEPVAPAIVWQCRRTADIAARELRGRDADAGSRARPGLVVDAYFSGSKIRWILRKRPGRPRAGARTASCCSATSIPG